MRPSYYLLSVVVLFSCSQSPDIENESFNLPDVATLELQEAFRITEPTEGAFFIFIWKIHVLSNGNLIVHDIRHPRLYEMTPDGDLVNVIGREGRGPGEFTQIRNSYVTANDSLHVFDPLNGRHQVFAKNKENEWEYTRERPYKRQSPTELKSQLPYEVLMGPNNGISGVFIILPQELSRAVPAYDTLGGHYQYVARLDHNIMQTDDNSRLKTVTNLVFYEGTGDRPGGIGNNERLWHLYYTYNPETNEVIYITNASNEIIAIDSTGNESVKGYLPYDRFPADQEAIEESMTYWKVNRVEGMINVLSRELLSHEPYYWNVFLAEDKLWVQLARSDKTKPNWVITSLDGKVLESFHGPTDIFTVAIHGDRMYGSIRDEDGVTYMVGFELVEAGN